MANLVMADFDTFLECGSSAAGDCFESNNTPFCDDAECCERVCERASDCCNGLWCAECVGVAEDVCVRPEACCLLDGTCTVLAPDDCHQRGGVAQGQGTTCADVECAGPEACCFEDGQCILIPPDQCRQQNGEPLGSGLVCQGDCNGNGIDDACETVGDLDGDGDVDLSDWRVLKRCLTGPADPVGPDCNSADLECDGRIDSRDVRLFQNAFSR